MLLRDFRNFIAVSETRSLSRAAVRAHLAQPALSRQIHELERELGVSLLERHSKGVTPTAAGQAFARGAANLLVTLGFAIARAEATSEGRRGRVSIGAMLTIIAAGIPAVVEERLHQEDPEITIAVEDLDPPDTVEQVRAGTIDIALAMAAAEDPDLLSEPLWDEYLDHVILPHGHPLAGRRRLKLTELGDYPLIIPQRALSPGVLDEIMAVLRKGGLRSPLLVVDVGLRDGHLAVSAGRGWSLIGRARSVSPPQGTSVVALADAAPKVRAAAIWRRDDKRPVLRRVLERIIDAVRDHPHACLRREPHLPPFPPARKTRQAPLGSVPALMEIRHLRALLEVAAAQTIGRAAVRLGVTQPALSRQLKELEHAIGLQLLERTARGVHLTPAGNSLAGECPGILAGLEQIVLDTTRARRGMEGRCVIGAVATLTTGELLTRVLTDVAQRHPHVHVVIEEVSTPLQAPAIVRGDIDVGLAHAHPGVTYPGLVVEPVKET
ncbi:MAG TPA: LysR family transcriptional regulator, partial [Gemmatimonadales bacterium]|nr:LysR family transcriptional regulator [Gemmatimonadales bacterium]